MRIVKDATGNSVYYCSGAAAPNADTVAAASTCYAALAPPPPRVDTSSGFCRWGPGMPLSDSAGLSAC
jgi:hypothetical protein